MMKRKNVMLLFAALFGASLLFNACNDDDDKDTGNETPDNIAGEVTGTLTLDASKTNFLNGSLVVKSGGVLNIPAGTVIEAKGGTTSYIAVAQGGKINITGTATKPVIMTSDVKEPGAWGGLVICGKAPINTGTTSTSEVGELPYGGSDSNDNSGTIQYLRVEYTGYIYTGEKQFNGVSFFGVGAGTTVDYVVSYKGNDDGLEFFGGTVKATHLVSAYSNDDGIDFADGWSGTGEYWYSYNSKKSGIEGSNNGSNGAATPMTNAKISHVTAYKMGEKPWYLKEGAGMQTISDVVIGGLADNKGHAYFYTDSGDDKAAERISAGDIKISDIKFIEMGAGNETKAVEGLTVGESTDATGAGNGTDKPSWFPDALNTISTGVTIF